MGTGQEKTCKLEIRFYNANMLKRKYSKIIHKRLEMFPAVALLGPRQSGKTTLAKSVSDIYFDLEDEQEKLRIDLLWNDVIKSEKTVILDEAQNYPEIFHRLRSEIDRTRKKNGRFLILGSVSPGLMKQVSEFLTGRIAVCELCPFYLQEIGKRGQDNLWVRGGFPDGGILNSEQFPVWQKSYLELLAMRDLPLWGMPSTPQVTQRLFKMLAAGHGTIWNASQIGKSMGLSYHTVNSYLNYLEQTYLIRVLPPYFANVKKRLVKSPKVYWRDTGLLHSLMGINSFDELITQPWVGLSWEGWVIEQILIYLKVNDIDHEPFYFRTSDGHELDLVLKIGNSLWAFEIKLTTSPGQSDLERLKKTAGYVNADKTVLISRTRNEIIGSNLFSTNVKGCFRLFEL